MTALGRDRRPPGSSNDLLARILERPGLVAAVRALPAPVLGRLIERIGLEDAGELVALATTAQLEGIFDDDLWRAARAGADETFRPERFALWLRVMLEAGEEALVQRLCALPQELLVLAVHRLVLVLDMDVLAEHLAHAGEEARPIERALEAAAFEEWEEFRVIARDPDVWDDVWGALLSLDRDHHERLRAILERCCAMSTEYISGQGGLFQVLTAAEMLDGDVAAARDDRRGAEGFVSPADARAFLALARRGAADGVRDPITRACLRELAGANAPARPADPASGAAPLAAEVDRRALAALLREAEVLSPVRPRAALAAGTPEGAPAPRRLAAPLFERAMSELRDRSPALFSTRARELGYLVNVWIAGGTAEGGRPGPVEALEVVLATCEAGLRARLAPARPTAARALAVLVETPADLLFRRGFARLDGDPRPRRG